MKTTRRTLRIPRCTALGTLLVLCATTGIASAATSAQLLGCQKYFDSQIRSYSNVVYQRLFGCAEKVVECQLAQEIDAIDATACLARATTGCASAQIKISDTATSRKAKVLLGCGSDLTIPLADLEQFDQGLGFFNVATACSAANVSALVDCVFANAQCAIEHQLFRLDPRAQSSLTTAGVAASFPCVAP